ncbi:hypothetical protein DPMN_108893 [Dreissena polymorpha]|uniref:Uncharacterized protein n=1 Tax=Dreissena polymorpha TaxID=45954 RepID=A0A9D4K9P0_DREPO|nr:hypothetical protein DPMN_108893 [Dreissena polymorpha]
MKLVKIGFKLRFADVIDHIVIGGASSELRETLRKSRCIRDRCQHGEYCHGDRSDGKTLNADAEWRKTTTGEAWSGVITPKKG